MTPVQIYPKTTCGGNLLEVPRPPTFCCYCKIKIEALDPCRSKNGVFVCHKARCWDALAHAMTYPYDGPQFFDPVFQHLRYLDRQKSNFWEDKPLEDWATWCKTQPLGIDSRAGYSLEYAEHWEKFPKRYEKESQ